MPKLFVGNWKMYLPDPEAEELARAYAAAADSSATRVIAAPGATALSRVAAVLKNSKALLGAQDLFWEERGAHTGEVSPADLASLGARYVIVGHSERRALGETDEIVAKKLAAARQAGLTPILCVGETREERAAGRREDVVRRQLESALSGAGEGPLAVAYEPRWAIGTGTPCDPDEAAAMHRFIRERLAGLGASGEAPVLYGGSVDPDNLSGFAARPEIDGVLVGGASTDAGKAARMISLLSSV